MTTPQSYRRNTINFFAHQFSQKLEKRFYKHPFRFDPYLTCAIIRRKPNYIAAILKSYSNTYEIAEHYDMLHKSQYNALRQYYGDSLLSNPLKLALEMCNSKIPEATLDREPTRFDVLHTLAAHFDDLVALAQIKEYPVPNLEEILKFASLLNSTLPLDTLILGLSDKNKQRAGKLLQRISNKVAYI